MDKVRKLPFSVNRNDARSLVDQVADGLRQAIVSNYWHVGDEIPSTRELVPMLGVSHIVTRAALSRLTAEGYVLTRHGLHPVVRDRNVKQWRGHVLFVYPDYDVGYFQAVMAETLRNRLNGDGYLFTRASVAGDGATGGLPDFSALDAALSRSVDLAVVLYNRPSIFRYLAKRGILYAAIAQIKNIPSGAVGVTRINYEGAVPGFAAACSAAGVRRVVQFGWDKLMCDAVPGLKAAGIAASRVFLKPDFPDGKLAGIERAGLDAFARLATSGRLSRDTVYFFADDYLGRGALSAMMGTGLRAPEDVRVATWANRGLGPVYFRTLSRMEMDPSAAGAAVADSILEHLRTGRYPGGRVIGPQWLDGETLGM